MLRRLIKVSAVVLGAGLVVTACSPVQAVSAAIVGNDRITIATLDTEVNNLSAPREQLGVAQRLAAEGSARGTAGATASGAGLRYRHQHGTHSRLE